tara:strand:- start:717 stop:1574 length:858 start_codon:yes stop_codon:yes gene_type:complete
MSKVQLSNKIKYSFASIIKNLSYKIGKFLSFFIPNLIIYGMQNKKHPIKYKNRKIFHIEDMSWITRYRAISFEYKEPETLKWIESFDQNQCLLDVGANIGIYTLFALFKGHEVIAIEPEAHNFCLLNRNIMINNFSDRAISYPVALNDNLTISKLNLASFEYGSALHSFDRAINQYGDKFNPITSQGVIGVTMDELISSLKKEVNHIKIDVDGNEFLVLKGGEKTFRRDSLQSVLIELDYTHMEYKNSVELIESYGFKLHNIDSELKKRIGRDSHSTANHIFLRV